MVNEHQTHLILEDSTYCREKIEQIREKGKSGEHIVQETTLRYFVHGYEGNNDNTCFYTRGTRDYEKLYFLDLLGVEDRREDYPSDMYKEFVESIWKDKQRSVCRDEAATAKMRASLTSARDQFLWQTVYMSACTPVQRCNHTFGTY